MANTDTGGVLLHVVAKIASTTSHAAARRLIYSGAVEVDGEVVTDPAVIVGANTVTVKESWRRSTSAPEKPSDKLRRGLMNLLTARVAEHALCTCGTPDTEPCDLCWAWAVLHGDEKYPGPELAAQKLAGFSDTGK